MNWATWSAYVVTYTLVCLTPGPAVVFVTSQSAWHGRSAGVRAAAGIATSNVVFWVLSALGLAAAIAASSILFMLLRWGGAAYLAWLGARAIIGSFGRGERDANMTSGVMHPYREGVLAGLSNPKAMFFFVALLPQFVNTSTPALPQIMLLGVTSALIDFPINAGYAVAAGQLRGSFARRSSTRWVERGVGGAFLSLAVATLLFRRPA